MLFSRSFSKQLPTSSDRRSEFALSAPVSVLSHEIESLQTEGHLIIWSRHESFRVRRRVDVED